MPEAYEVGITLALQDGVSAGIQLIRRDLALLDRAIAATSQNLSRLQTQDAGPPVGLPVQPASPGATERESYKPREAEATSTDASFAEPDASRVAKPRSVSAALQGNSEDFRPAAALATVGTAAPQSRNVLAGGDIDAPEAPVHKSSANWPVKLANATTADPASLPGPAAPKLANKPQTVVSSEVASAQGSPVERLIGPTAPRFVASDARDDSFGQTQSLGQRARPVLTNGKAKSAAPSEEPVAPAALQSLAKRTSNRDQQLAPVPSRSPPPGSERRYEPHSFPSQRGAGDMAVADRDMTPPFSRRAAPESSGSQSAVPATALDLTQARDPELSSSAPPTQSSQSITLQGDIIIDGSRLGRWMTSSLARQASRPPSGPVGPDPRQTPLWSGQAQGF